MENDTSLVAKKKMLKNEAMIADTNSSLPNKAENLVHSEERIEPVFEHTLEHFIKSERNTQIRKSDKISIGWE